LDDDLTTEDTEDTEDTEASFYPKGGKQGRFRAA